MKETAVAIGIAEFRTIASGVAGMDCAVKNNDIILLRAEMICPGGYLILFVGRYAAVYSAVDLLRRNYLLSMTGSVVIGNLSEGVLEILSPGKSAEAVGIIETADTVSAIYAADEAVKTSDVWIEDLRLANGIGGKGIVFIAGGIAEVDAALQKATALCKERQSLIDSAVITNPHDLTCEKLFNKNTRRIKNV
ncbi:BMC domain-containing protein [Treponema primitia]|uniref:BMC domain-containing protein n=1 Tax=Treponema primitia TaxID=88058 RepID=UPI0002554F23|nr:BMC domain-containing protein [Treponema primitia]